MGKTLSNATARKYFCHDHDFNSNDLRCCFFSNGFQEDGWGFWVAPNGTVDVDDVSSNGELPSEKVVAACVRAAVKFLRK